MGNACPSGFLTTSRGCVYDCSQESEWFRTTIAGATARCNLRTSTVDGFSLNPLPAPPRIQQGQEFVVQTMEMLKTSNPSLYQQYQAEQQRVKERVASLNSDAASVLRDVNQSLKPFRPPTAPASDKAIERKAILSGNQSLVFIQLVLFILLAVLVSYLLLPTHYANGIAFVLLCVGVAYGFFLRR